MHLKHLVLIFSNTFLWICPINGNASFTRAPPPVKYVVQGQTVKLVWDYTVDNRNNEFEVNSPRWDFYERDGTVIPIASEDSQYGWKWALHKDTCPKRLINRVRKESTATLVISNVTTDDNGVYGCSLVMKISSAVTRKVKLVVTTIPYFTTKQPLNKFIKEGSNLVILCSAHGFPKPNITWVRSVGNSSIIKSQGVGNASLHISNITRDENGTYTCQANNNPNEEPVEKHTRIIVMFSPEFLNRPPKEKFVIEGMGVDLNCSANGNPLPNITWLHMYSGTEVTKSHGIARSTFSLPNITREDNGTYECRATNYINEQENTLSLFTEVKVMCYCNSGNSSLASVQNGANDAKNEGLQDNEINNILNGKTFMTSLLAVTCISVLANVILIIYICLKTKRAPFKVTDKGKETIRFGPPQLSKDAKDGMSQGSLELNSTPPIRIADSPTEVIVKKPINDTYEHIPELSESSCPDAAHSYGTPAENNQNKSPKSESSKESDHGQSSQPESLLQHHYQDLDDFTSTLHKQEYQSLDRSEIVITHPKHSSVAPIKYEALTFGKKNKTTEYQKLHVYANVKNKDDKKTKK